MAVESFCGVKPRSLLESSGDEHMITFAQGGLGVVTEEGVKNAAATDEQFKCAMNVMASADLKRRGIPLICRQSGRAQPLNIAIWHLLPVCHVRSP
jgi:hypothetical protein